MEQDWTAGAFAWAYPGQFQELLDALQESHEGKVFFAGEYTSKVYMIIQVLMKLYSILVWPWMDTGCCRICLSSVMGYVSVASNQRRWINIHIRCLKFFKNKYITIWTKISKRAYRILMAYLWCSRDWVKPNQDLDLTLKKYEFWRHFPSTGLEKVLITI